MAEYSKFETEELTDEICELNLNVDDMTAEELGYAMEKIYNAGAVECFFTSVTMKKSRPGVLITVLCKEEKKPAVIEAVFKHTTTIGIRETISKRYTLRRCFEEVETSLGTIGKKISEGYGVKREKLEFDDIKRIADENNLSVKDVIKLTK